MMASPGPMLFAYWRETEVPLYQTVAQVSHSRLEDLQRRP
jgi:hypothetical protein